MTLVCTVRRKLLHMQLDVALSDSASMSSSHQIRAISGKDLSGFGSHRFASLFVRQWILVACLHTSVLPLAGWCLLQLWRVDLLGTCILFDRLSILTHLNANTHPEPMHCAFMGATVVACALACVAVVCDSLAREDCIREQIYVAVNSR